MDQVRDLARSILLEQQLAILILCFTLFFLRSFEFMIEALAAGRRSSCRVEHVCTTLDSNGSADLRHTVLEDFANLKNFMCNIVAGFGHNLVGGTAALTVEDVKLDTV